jgi:hypothetical protein
MMLVIELIFLKMVIIGFLLEEVCQLAIKKSLVKAGFGRHL